MNEAITACYQAFESLTMCLSLLFCCSACHHMISCASCSFTPFYFDKLWIPCCFLLVISCLSSPKRLSRQAACSSFWSFTCSFLGLTGSGMERQLRNLALLPEKAGSRSYLPFTNCVTISEIFNLQTSTS